MQCGSAVNFYGFMPAFYLMTPVITPLHDKIVYYSYQHGMRLIIRFIFHMDFAVDNIVGAFTCNRIMLLDTLYSYKAGVFHLFLCDR